MIHVTAHISIDEREIEESFVRSSGPGGQNVNKLATAVQLRFDVRHSPSLPADVRARVAARLEWLGAELDAAANAAHAMLISRQGSRLALYVIPTDEELMIARHTSALLPPTR